MVNIELRSDGCEVSQETHLLKNVSDSRHSVSSELDPLQSEIKNKDGCSFLFKKIRRTRNSRKPKFDRLASRVRQKCILTAVALKSYDYKVVKQFCWSKLKAKISKNETGHDVHFV